jgi:hypothetical protein
VSWLDESPPTILTYTRDDDGSCVAVEVTDATGALALEALAPEQFVEARFDVETRGEALAVVRLSTPDGASGVHAFYDLGREHLCAPIDAGGEGWCLWGVTQVTAHFFADASCSNPVASRGACAAPPQVAIVDAASDACDPPSVRLHDVGPETAAYWLDGSCVAVEGIFYRVGAALEEGAFERVPGAEVGGRLTVRKWMNGGVPAADAGYYFYDRDLGIACIPRVIGGEQRCLPVQESVAVYSYADPACSQPLHASAHALCGWPEHVLLSHKDSCGLPMIEEVRPVMGTHEGAFYHLGDSGCVSAGEGNAALLGPPIDPSSFAALSTELR